MRRTARYELENRAREQGETEGQAGPQFRREGGSPSQSPHSSRPSSRSSRSARGSGVMPGPPHTKLSPSPKNGSPSSARQQGQPTSSSPTGDKPSRIPRASQPATAAQIDKTDAAIGAIHKDVSAVKTSLGPSFRHMGAGIKHLDSKLGPIDARLTAIERRLERVEALVGGCDGRLKKMEEGQSRAEGRVEFAIQGVQAVVGELRVMNERRVRFVVPEGLAAPNPSGHPALADGRGQAGAEGRRGSGRG
ncbi:MAG: hypothetical protein M1814_005240 [Vezdaea aestivalis]|nr:MAG: hypothetical protein M1814_005240 [Vezdaea aestivalis]